jgi:glycosyltransferase involved in cell wall biosynthesis
MSYLHAVLGGILGAVWLSRVLDSLAMLRIPDLARPEWDSRPDPAPQVSIIIPARDEEAELEPALRSVLALDYGDFEVIAVNDRSRDGTGAILDRLAAEHPSRLKAVHIESLPPGWLGKTHALWQGALRAGGEWLLFTDADVRFRADALRRALAYAESERADHLVLFPTVEMRTPGERMMMAFFMLQFTFGHRAWKVADPKSKDHIGVGAFNLVRRAAYDTFGGHEALRLEVIDDMKLGKLVKDHGFAQRNVFGEGLLRLRWAQGAAGVVRNLTKNMFSLMHFHWPRSLGAALLLGVLSLGPYAGLLLASGWSRTGYALAVGAIALLYGGLRLRAQISPLYFVLHPVAGAIYIYVLLSSAAVALWRGGVVWRGTKYSLEELRRGRVV